MKRLILTLFFLLSLLLSIAASSYNLEHLEVPSEEMSIKESANVTTKIPLYQYHKKIKGDSHFYYDTRSSVESDKGDMDGVVCYVQNDNSNGAVPLYQYHVHDTNRFYYSTKNEILYGWIFDGIVCYVFTGPGDSRKPLYIYAKNVKGNQIYYLDTRSSVESDKGVLMGIAGYVY